VYEVLFHPFCDKEVYSFVCQIQYPLSGRDATNTQGFFLVGKVINFYLHVLFSSHCFRISKMLSKIVLLRSVSNCGFGVYMLHTDVNFLIPSQALMCSKLKWRS
jgi:hypothetical protein